VVSKRGAGADPADTRSKLIDAALETLSHDGYAGASARAIAGAAGCNQASIYYHFGGIEPLLIAALMDSSKRRYARYREAIDPLVDIGSVLREWQRLHDEDIASGHITALTELVGAIGAEPGLRDGVNETVKVWTGFIEETIERVLNTTPLAGIVPLADASTVIFALFLGIELMTHLDGDSERAERLFAVAGLLTSLAPKPITNG
jgi:AcrR family transcriptional regulator